MDHIIDLIVKAQQDDGYLNVYFTAVDPAGKFRNLRDMHEMCKLRLRDRKLGGRRGSIAYRLDLGLLPSRQRWTFVGSFVGSLSIQRLPQIPGRHDQGKFSNPPLPSPQSFSETFVYLYSVRLVITRTSIVLSTTSALTKTRSTDTPATQNWSSPSSAYTP
jgi:hypothetical protein